MNNINCKGKILKLSQPIVMGIINVTPDSFYEGHLFKSKSEIVTLAGKMIADGATILDIGGQSSKPGSIRILPQEEMERVLPIVETLSLAYPETILSIDTFSSQVATAAIKAGASIVNDIAAGNMDKDMLHTVALLQVPYICMHMQGTPESMQQNPTYKNVVTEVLDFFKIKLEECRLAGIKDVIIDPGFGFGKTIEHNFQLLKGLAVLANINKPILVGLSRKSSIYKTLGITADDALNGTTVVNTLALMNGACILRVHDVKEAMEAISLYKAYKKAP